MEHQLTKKTTTYIATHKYQIWNMCCVNKEFCRMSTDSTHRQRVTGNSQLQTETDFHTMITTSYYYVYIVVKKLFLLIELPHQTAQFLNIELAIQIL